MTTALTRLPLKDAADSIYALALPAPEGIAVQVRAVTSDRARRLASYELLVRNTSPSPIEISACLARAKQRSATTTYSKATVPALETVSVKLDVCLPLGARESRVFFELRGENLRLSLDAPTVAPQRSKRPLFAAVAGLVAVALAAAGYALRPDVIAAAAPPSVVAGQRFAVVYAARGLGNVSYAVLGGDGATMRIAPLAGRAGSFEVDVPRAAEPRQYDVRITDRGPLGVHERDAFLWAMPPASAPPHVARPVAHVAEQLPSPAPFPSAALTLASDTVAAGQPIAVSFPPGAARGTARLLDQNGSIRATALIRSDGAATFVAPKVPADQQFRVDVQVPMGSAMLEAAAGVLVKSTASSRQAALKGKDSGSNADKGAPFAAGDAAARAGSLFPITIVHPEQRLRIALLGAVGNEIAVVDVPPRARDVALRVPPGARAENGILVATFSRGAAQETIVRPIRITAANGAPQ